MKMLHNITERKQNYLMAPTTQCSEIHRPCALDYTDAITKRLENIAIGVIRVHV